MLALPDCKSSDYFLKIKLAYVRRENQLTCIIFHHILVVSVGGGEVHAAAGP